MKQSPLKEAARGRGSKCKNADARHPQCAESSKAAGLGAVGAVENGLPVSQYLTAGAARWRASSGRKVPRWKGLRCKRSGSACAQALASSTARSSAAAFETALDRRAFARVPTDDLDSSRPADRNSPAPADATASALIRSTLGRGFCLRGARRQLKLQCRHQANDRTKLRVTGRAKGFI